MNVATMEETTMRTLEDAARDDAEWAALELERAAVWRGKVNRYGIREPVQVACGVSYRNAPHRDSYGAHLPMQSQSLPQLNKTSKQERALLAARPVTLHVSGGTDDELAGRAVDVERNKIASRIGVLEQRRFQSRMERNELAKLRTLTTQDVEQRAEKASRDIMQQRERVNARATELSLFLSY